MLSARTTNSVAPGQCIILNKKLRVIKEPDNTPDTNTNNFILFDFNFPTHLAFRTRPVFYSGFWSPLYIYIIIIVKTNI